MLSVHGQTIVSSSPGKTIHELSAANINEDGCHQGLRLILPLWAGFISAEKRSLSRLQSAAVFSNKFSIPVPSVCGSAGSPPVYQTAMCCSHTQT